MAATLVQSTAAFTAATGTTRAVAYGSNTTSGNTLVAVAIWIGASSGTATNALADSQGNTWSAIAASLSTRAPGRLQVYSAPCGSSAANTVTMTVSASMSERVLFIGEVSGLTGSIGSAPLAANGSSTNPTANITCDAADSFLLGGLFTNSSATEGAGYTIFGGATQDGNVAEYRITGSAGPIAVAFVQAVSAVWAISAAEFLASGGGGGTTVKQLAALGVG